VTIVWQSFTAGANYKLSLQIHFLQHLQTRISCASSKQITQHTGAEIAVNPFTTSRQQSSGDSLPGGN